MLNRIGYDTFFKTGKCGRKIGNMRMRKVLFDLYFWELDETKNSNKTNIFKPNFCRLTFPIDTTLYRREKNKYFGHFTNTA